MHSVANHVPHGHRCPVGIDHLQPSSEGRLADGIVLRQGFSVSAILPSRYALFGQRTFSDPLVLPIIRTDYQD